MAEEEKPVNTSDASQVRKSKRKAKLERERQIEECRQLLATVGGRHFVWRMLSNCGVFHSGFQETTIAMAHKVGMRDAGLWVLEEVFTSFPEAYTMMCQEAEDRKL